MVPNASSLAGPRAVGIDAGAARPAAAGIPGRTQLAPRAAQAPRDLALGAAELRGILRVVEDCERATTLPAFREATLDALSRHLGYRNSAFFLGQTLEAAFQDQRPSGRGLALRMAGPFLERYRGLEVFSDPESLRLMRERGLVTLEDIGNPARPEVRLRMERFLRAHGINSKLLLRLTGPANIGAVVTLLDPRPGAFGPRDRAIAAVVGRHLGNLLRFHVRANTGPAVTAKLSARERDVVRLVAEGHSNRQVAEALCISIDTVKHHLTHALVATSCTNRTQLALAWQREMGPSTSSSGPAPTRD
ncbi:response regulator transcription factor [Frankia sp. CNm7]|uniref:Response regulator transcription factor n=1 Tax=Frankia nepalensis TaxID=1836974 RepID=A0A937RJ12_9ACTN|nr:LuxR C-terminal-related transcriptional regulator [Frankia nepalensis]MBL7494745.1 response regulator transcription factor [Frankia nepalensis]MBL7514859.1 response regulator transcription factor [Frankia nepalensis]MBL7524813.1 response regulator transcription factor [Frankia nepalensis]MBL7626861.1 response regulator transcription factor [Frankia nepalensis]